MELLAEIHTTVATLGDAEAHTSHLDAVLAALQDSDGATPPAVVRDCCGPRLAPELPLWYRNKVARRPPEALRMTHTLEVAEAGVHVKTLVHALPPKPPR